MEVQDVMLKIYITIKVHAWNYAFFILVIVLINASRLSQEDTIGTNYNAARGTFQSVVLTLKELPLET